MVARAHNENGKTDDSSSRKPRGISGYDANSRRFLFTLTPDGVIKFCVAGKTYLVDIDRLLDFHERGVCSVRISALPEMKADDLSVE